MRYTIVIDKPRGINVANLVRRADSDTYRLVSDSDMTMLSTLGQVVPERTRSKGKMFVHYYIEK